MRHKLKLFFYLRSGPSPAIWTNLLLYLRGPSPDIWTNLLLYLRGPSPAIWTTSPEFLKEVFIKDAETFIDRPMLGKNTEYLSSYLFIDRPMLGKNTKYLSIYLFIDRPIC